MRTVFRTGLSVAKFCQKSNLVKFQSRYFSSLPEPSEKIKQLCQSIVQLDLVEVNQLLQGIAIKVGLGKDFLLQRSLAMSGDAVPMAGNTGAAGSAAIPAEAPKVKDIFDVKLKVVDAKAKIKVIKEIRTITGLGLKEAKELVEKAPVVVKAGVKKEEVDSITKLIVEAGGEIEVV